MATSPTKPGTLKLSEVARKVSAPTGISHTGWPKVLDCCTRKMGVGFDPWQDAAGRLILAERPDGKLAAMIDGVGLSLPRQVGKTYLIMSIVFALCILKPGLLVIWSAHHARTHQETFLAMQAFAARPKVAPCILQIFTGSGDEEIRFVNRSRVLFGARERGFGRGIPGVDVLIADEAQIMTEKALDAQLATMNTSSFGLSIFMGTPPRPDDPSEAFARMRADAWAGRLTDGAWIEFGAEPGDDPDSHATWRKAVPAFPDRTPVESMLRLRRKLADDSWRREGLGIWDEFDRMASVFDMDRWAALEVAGDEVPGGGRVAYGIKFSPDGDSVALAVAQRAGDLVHVEGVDHRSMVDGTRWLVDWLLDRWPSAAAVVVDGKSGAGAFVKALGRAGMRGRKLTVATAEQVITATSSAVTAVSEGTVTHIGDPVLTAAVRSSGKRSIGRGGGYGLQSRDGSDVTLAEAAVLAHFGVGLARGGGSDRSGDRTSSRRAVVLS